jgi:AP2 domain
VIGEKFGRLTVLEELRKYNGKWNESYLRCVCECGNEKDVRTRDVTSGRTKSCGCLRDETTTIRSTKHGLAGTRFHNIWRSVKDRCQNERNYQYKDYGGRGVGICNHWQTFENFYNDLYESYRQHVMEHGEKQTSLDRIDVNGDYEPKNCRWATSSVQSFNQRKKRTNTSGVIGVSWHKQTSKWSAQIRIDGKKIHLGTFNDFGEAVTVRQEAELKYYGFHSNN